MNTYEITFIDFVGQVVVEVIQADTLIEAKRICKEYYSVKRFI